MLRLERFNCLSITKPSTGFENHGDSPFAECAREEGFKIDVVYQSYQLLTFIVHKCPDYCKIAEKHAKVFKSKETTSRIYQALRRGMEMPPSAFKALLQEKQDQHIGPIAHILAWNTNVDTDDETEEEQPSDVTAF